MLTKVRLADIFNVSTYLKETKQDYRYFNKIAQKHVDFLICTADTLTPLIGIELNDSSHHSFHRAERDREVETIFRYAQLPLCFERHIDK